MISSRDPMENEDDNNRIENETQQFNYVLEKTVTPRARSISPNQISTPHQIVNFSNFNQRMNTLSIDNNLNINKNTGIPNHNKTLKQKYSFSQLKHTFNEGKEELKSHK